MRYSIAGLMLMLGSCLSSMGQPGWQQAYRDPPVRTQAYYCCPPGQQFCYPPATIQPRGDYPVGVPGTPQFVPNPPTVEPVKPIPHAAPKEPTIDDEFTISQLNFASWMKQRQEMLAELAAIKQQLQERSIVTPAECNCGAEIAKLEQRIAALEILPTAPNMDAVASEVVRRIPPWQFHFRVVDPAGKYTTQPVTVRNGEQLNLVLQPADSGITGLTQPTVEAK